MPRTKNALVRQRVIDRCLGSPKNYSIKGLMEACNRELESIGENPVTAMNFPHKSRSFCQSPKLDPSPFPAAIQRTCRLSPIVGDGLASSTLTQGIRTFSLQFLHPPP